MTTLEDKILGEKRHVYCSSSSESENDDVEEPNSNVCGLQEKESLDMNGTDIPKNLYNTGPKGVIDDKRYFEYLKKVEREKTDKARYELIKKSALTCSSTLDDEVNQSNENDPSSDNFIVQYRKKRMSEMLSQITCHRKFGKLINLSNKGSFLEAVDKEGKTTLVVIHIYDNVSICKKINNMLNILAKEHKNVKFCKILSVVAGLSLNFKISGIPAFLVYKNKQLVGNFVRVTDDLGDDFCETDIETFFFENGILLNQSSVVTDDEKF